MVNYQEGKIYKIVSNTDDDICYVGSTTKKFLSQRMAEHRNSYKRWKNGKGDLVYLYKLFECYGIENYRIELLEIFPCNTKDELSKKEGQYITALNCVNKNIAGRIKNEWRLDNKKIISDYEKQRYKNDKNKIQTNVTNYYNKNKNVINEQRKQKYTCQCGSNIRIAGKAEHERSKKHMDFITSDDNV